MFRNLSFQKKFYGMVGGLVMVLLVGYFLSFQRTLDLRRENAYLSGLTQRSEDQIIRSIARLSDEKKLIDSAKQVLVRADSESVLFAVIVDRADRFNLDIFQMEEQSIDGAELYDCVFEGLYINMVRFTRFVEQELKAVSLESQEYYINIDRKTKERYLRMKMVLRKNEY